MRRSSRDAVSSHVGYGGQFGQTRIKLADEVLPLMHSSLPWQFRPQYGFCRQPAHCFVQSLPVDGVKMRHRPALPIGISHTRYR